SDRQAARTATGERDRWRREAEIARQEKFRKAAREESTSARRQVSRQGRGARSRTRMMAHDTAEVHNPLHAKFYADGSTTCRTKVVENVRLARDTYRIRFDCRDIARTITPGQFVMLRLADCNDPLLARPLALYDTVLDNAGKRIGIDLVYLVSGKFTRRL